MRSKKFTYGKKTPLIVVYLLTPGYMKDKLAKSDGILVLVSLTILLYRVFI
jgi:hypothetical protein